ncbi:DMT family transporter [Ramlibacter sp. XY19]|uniref:DMT family transporter n=1 Tax=Ramlibacter paludis TaxID=2908000 RepID=UPI0023DBBC55|nr:DMT family transporter [Ramlibacter paludis]MCG2591967.1 DMT family transporter [Ramlibacter paludis]
MSAAADGQGERALPGLVLAFAGAIAFSGKAIIVKLAYRYGVDAVTLIMLRMAFALPLFLGMAWWAGRGQPALAARDWLGVAGLGFSGYYLSSFLDFVGLQYITAALERLIMYLTPTLVLVLGSLLYRRQWRRAQVAGMAISYVGVLIVFGQELKLEGSNVPLGALLVFASTVSYALYLVFSGEFVKRIGSLRLVGLATSVACACCIAQFLLLRPWAAAFAVAPQVVGLSVLNATLCTAVPVLLVMMAIERIGPAATSQAGMVGPLSTIFLGVWLLGEPFTAWLAAGTLLVLAGIFVFSRPARSS